MNKSLLTEDDYIEAVIDNIEYWDCIPDKFKTKSFALKAIDIFDRDFVYFFEIFPNHFRDDKEIVLKAVNKDGTAIREVSERLKNDREVALAAFTCSWKAFMFFGKDLAKELREHGYYGMQKTGEYLKKVVIQDQLKEELETNLPLSKRVKL
jgi:aromatic ring-opening dioxygenase LigB subunit